MWVTVETHIGFLSGNLRERDHLEYPDVERIIILKCIFKKWVGNTDWIDLAEDRDRWRTLVNAVMNLRVPYIAGSFLTS